MNRCLTEQKVLDKLGIEDFRHLTKEKVVTMATMLDKMDPEVAKKALDQFPEFASTMKEILCDYKESAEAALKSNDENVKSWYVTCDATITALLKELETNDLTFDQKRYIVDQVMILLKMKSDVDSRNKGFVATMHVLGVVAIGITATALVTALGGNAKFDFKDIPKISNH